VTSRDGRERFHAEIPAEVKAAVDDTEETNWRLVTKAVRQYLGLGDLTTEMAFERRLEELENRENELAQIIDERETELEEIREERARVQAQYEDYLEDRESYENQLHEILSALNENPTLSIISQRSELEEAAMTQYGQRTEDAIGHTIEDAMELAQETEEYNIMPKQWQENPNLSGGMVADGEGAPELRSSTDGGETSEDE
jgi:seryl-tRNA synthetase